MCDGTISDHFRINTGVSLGCVLGRMSEKSGCVVSSGTVRITDLDFADDAVVFSEITEVTRLSPEALELLSEKAKPLGFRLCWITTKVQKFGDILEATIGPTPVL